MSDPTPNPDQVTVIIELLGGPFDGQTFLFKDHGQIPSLENWGEEDQAIAMYRDSSNGRIGERFRCHADCSIAKFPHTVQVGEAEARLFAEIDLLNYHEHEYVVTDRLDVGHEVLIQARHTNEPSPATVIVERIHWRPK